MVKITALYGMPKDPEAFEKYYAETHMPMVYACRGPRPYRAWQADAGT